MNKVAAYDQVSHIHDQAKFTFIEQPDSEQYGTAVPVKLCEDLLKNEEAFFVFMGDVFTYGKNGRSEAKEMAELFNKSQGGGVASFIERPENELHKYGIAEIEEKNDIKYLKNIVEKPAPGEAPSNLSNTSQYILTPAAFKIIENQAVDPKSGELYITDTVKEIAKQSGIAVHIPQNEFLDGGSVKSWLKANLTVAWDNPELKKELREFISKLD